MVLRGQLRGRVGRPTASRTTRTPGPPVVAGLRTKGLANNEPFFILVNSVSMAPSVYIIAGSNGAGKTTFAREFLPRYANCKHFVNADLIAAGVSPFSPEAAAFRAGRLMLEEIERLANRGDDFGFETTLAGMTYMNLIHRLRRQRYSVHIFFLWVVSLELALSRIKDRVMEGGHDVPEAIVRRRFDRSIKNFLCG